MKPNPGGTSYHASSAQKLPMRVVPLVGTLSASTSTVLGITVALSANPAQAEAPHQPIQPSRQTPDPQDLAHDRPITAIAPPEQLLGHSFLLGDRIDQQQIQFSQGQKSFAQPTHTQLNEFQLAQSDSSPTSTPPTIPATETTTPAQPPAKPSKTVLKEGSLVLGSPYVRFQGAYVLQGDESSARARLTGLYPLSPNLLFGAEVDLTSGSGFSDSPGTGLRLNELYFAVSPQNVPNLRFVGGLMDLTSYFDRNSFAKDGTTHFFNRVFQTNPALSAAGIASRPGFLVNWSATDYLDLKAAAFSSRRDLGRLTLDSFAGEVGVRFGNAIIRGTYVTSRDSGQRTGFEEIFSLQRSNGIFGLRSGDREEAFGINGEVYIPSLKMGLFARYGRYNNVTLGRGGDTYSFGLNLLDTFLPNDRLGIGYGRQLSNEDLRRERGDKVPDVLEVFYDVRIVPNLRAGIMFQQRNQFSETVFGFRIKTEFDLVPFRRPFR